MNPTARYHRDIETLFVTFRPSREELFTAWNALVKHFGFARAVVICDLSTRSAIALKRRQAVPQSRERAIWLTYAITLAPHLIRSRFDMLTWGRFATEPVKAPGNVMTADHYEI